MLVFPAWAAPSNMRSDDDAPTVLEVIWGVVDWATTCNENDQECKKREGEYRKRENEENARRAKENQKKWREKNRTYKTGYLGIALTMPFFAEEEAVAGGAELVWGVVSRFGEIFMSLGGGTDLSAAFYDANMFYRPPIDMNGIWKIAPEVGIGVTSYEPFDSDDYVEPLFHYSLGVRYEHTLQSRENIVEDEDVLINGVSVGCAVWMNYADFAGVKCDVRFGLYL
jgi:hypothetical protein